MKNHSPSPDGADILAEFTKQDKGESRTRAPKEQTDEVNSF